MAIAPALGSRYQYHAFLAFSYKDEEHAVKIKRYLDERGFKVMICHEFEIGKAIVDNIKDTMEKSRRAVALISGNYIKSKWFDYETLHMVHQSAVNKKMSIIPVRLGIEAEEMPPRLRPYNALDYTGQESDLEKLAAAIAAPEQPMDLALPVGNIALGLVWSFFYGYLKLILPHIPKKCRDCEWWGSDSPKERKMIDKLIIIIPESGFCPSLISDAEEDKTKAQHVGTLKEHTANRAGLAGRSYKNSVYKLRNSEGEEYYGVVEYATPVMSMYEMELEGFSGLTEDEKRKQIINFYEYLERLMLIPEGNESRRDVSKTYGGGVLLVRYPDTGSEKPSVVDLVVEEIKKSLDNEARAMEELGASFSSL